MLDLLLTRALQATGKLCVHPASKLPSPEQLELVRSSDQYKEYMLDAIDWIDAHDGRHVFTERQGELVFFGKLLSYVLWQLAQRQLTWPQYYNLLLDEN